MRRRRAEVNRTDAPRAEMGYSGCMAEAASTLRDDKETPAERETRLARGRTFLAEGLADVAAGRVIEGDDAVRWLEAEIAETEAAAS